MTFDPNTYDPQPAITDVPLPTAAPVQYASGTLLLSTLQRYLPATTISVIPDGVALVASMRADEEGPYMGVKLDPQQDREWPRTFKYGWPNIIAAPSAILVSRNYPGAWYLDYEAVVPQQVLDWVALECYRLMTLPFDRQVSSESVTGASIKYMPWAGQKGEVPAMLDEIQSALLSPFQLRSGHTSAFPNYGSL